MTLGTDTVDAVRGVAVIAGALAMPHLVRLVPEPANLPLPAPGAAAETELDRIIRAEGPRPSYADVAAEKGLRWRAFGVMLVLAGWSWHSPARVAIVSGLLLPVFALLVLIDWRTKLLPRVVVLPVSVLLAGLAVADWAIRRDTAALTRELCGGASAWLIFGALWFIRRAGMGFGDVRLAFPLGVLMAAVSWNAWLVGLYAAFVAFTIFGVGLAAVTRDRSVLKRAYPFGPFMIAGAYAGMALDHSIRLLG